MEWIKQKDFLSETISAGKKYRLEGAERNPSTLNIEDDLLKWIEEQRRLEIAISTNEIIAKLLEMDLKKKIILFIHCRCGVTVS